MHTLVRKTCHFKPLRSLCAKLVRVRGRSTRVPAKPLKPSTPLLLHDFRLADFLGEILLALPPCYASMFACVCKRAHETVQQNARLAARTKVPCASTIVKFLHAPQCTISRTPSSEACDNRFYQEHRPRSLNWMLGVIHTEKLPMQTYFHAVVLFDRFYAAKACLAYIPHHVEKMPLVTTACLVLACKMLGANVWTVCGHDANAPFLYTDALKNVM